MSADRSASRWPLAKMLRSAEGRIGIAVLAFVLAAVLAGPYLTGYDATSFNIADKFQPPSARHWLGTDEVGRDVATRVMLGGRMSILAGGAIVVIAAVLGIPIGLVAGYGDGWLDRILMRFTDMILGFPALMLAVAVSAAAGPGLWHGVIAVALVWWPGFARLTRGQALQAKRLEFVLAARSAGASPWHIVWRHVLPAVAGPALVKVTMDIGFAVVAVASLGFLGLGAQPPLAEWGTMIADSRSYVLQYWWTGTFPGVALFLTSMAFNLAGDALQRIVQPDART